MAKHVIAEGYSFTPATRTIAINNKYFRQEQLLLITNVTKGTVIYNFSDPTLGASSYTNAANTINGAQVTTIVLNYNTAGMTSTDKLAIMVEEINESFNPSEEYKDPVGKFRTSQPQALIDTDFEYGTQSTKWETLSLLNNRPFAFYNVTSPINISNVYSLTPNSRTFIANSFPSAPPPQGTPFYMLDTTFTGADGLFVVDYSNLAANTFQYTGRSQYTGTAPNIFNGNVTTAFGGNVFSNSIITTSNITFNTANVITVSTSIPHGLLVGNEIALVLANGTNAPNGSWIVSTVSNNTTFSFVANSTPGGAITGGNLYVRPLGLSYHRAFDGGVQFSTNAQSHNQQIIRQTRRYFRYQSGKGIQISTGTILKPNINVDQIKSVGTTVTVVCKQQHNIAPLTAYITITGANETAYNGTFQVASVIDPYTFTYTATTAPSASTASGNYVLSVTSWYGASNRLGMFDGQNGIFFEFDGQTLYAVKRSSTYQLSGFVSVSPGSETVTGVTYNGVSTVFSKQLVPGDFIVIKGMSYRVDSIANDTSLTIVPSYRGAVPITNAIVSKTIDNKTPQANWNLDKLDGTGPSGMVLDLSRMQMFYMDYSWYGAGFIRYGFRGSNGDVTYCHKVMNNNINYEAYMRSGNLPARYETTSFPKVTYITSSVGSSDTTMLVNDTSGFPTAGTVAIRTANTYEYVNYTGTTPTQFTGLTRGQAGNTNALITTTANNPVVTITNTSGLQVGQYVTSQYVPSTAFITNVIAGTSITLSIAPFGTGTNIPAVIPPLASTAQTWVYSANTPTIVEFHGPMYSPVLSHWGTSVIMDGRFDDDKSFVFTSGTPSGVTVGIGARNAIQSFRIAPSVSNGIAGAGLGIREIVNRMQMVLRQMDVFANSAVLINLVLNTTVSPGTPSWTSVGGSSLAQYINHTPGTTVSGGEVIFGFFLNTVGGAGFQTTQQDLTLVRDMGTSILSGGNSNLANVNIYPDGPDMITVVATNIGNVVANINSRMSWTEAQA